MASPQPRIGVVTYPGSQDDRDALWAIAASDAEAVPVWHEERELPDLDAVIVPGGFSYGDYLRCGAIARFSPATQAIVEFANAGGLVLGICNGFQILCEAGLLPGALTRNDHLEFRCDWVHLRVDSERTPWTSGLKGRALRMPIAHGEGNYVLAGDMLPQVVLRYCDAQGNVTPEANPNGSAQNIAGVMNAAGNVFGLMPHPERANEPLLGSSDGRLLFESLLAALPATALAA